MSGVRFRPVLPRTAQHILEVGAASGGTLRWLKEIFPGAVTTGVEPTEAAATALRKNADIALVGSVEECLPRLRRYGLILLLDVLEHLVDPASVLRALTRLFEPGGHMVVSLPNVAHLSVSLPLLLRRRFEYQDSGILDRTHLRFFVADSAIQILNDAGLCVTAGLLNGLEGPRAHLLDRLSLGRLRHHLTKQYVMLAERAAGAATQTPVAWQPSPRAVGSVAAAPDLQPDEAAWLRKAPAGRRPRWRRTPARSYLVSASTQAR